jgi:hypothetical protein
MHLTLWIDAVNSCREWTIFSGRALRVCTQNWSQFMYWVRAQTDFFFNIPRFARLLIDSGYAKSAVMKVLKCLRNRTRGTRNLEKLLKVAKVFNFFCSALRTPTRLPIDLTTSNIYPACRALQASMLGIIAWVRLPGHLIQADIIASDFPIQLWHRVLMPLVPR